VAGLRQQCVAVAARPTGCKLRLEAKNAPAKRFARTLPVAAEAANEKCRGDQSGGTCGTTSPSRTRATGPADVKTASEMPERRIIGGDGGDRTPDLRIANAK